MCFVFSQNKWVPRRVDNNPKTIDQIHKEVAQENQEKAYLAQQAQLQQKAQRGGRSFSLYLEFPEPGDTETTHLTMWGGVELP